MSNLTGRPVYQKPVKSGTVAEGKERMARVAKLPCSVCIAMPVEVHHAKTKMGQPHNDMWTFPLCFLHHRGSEGIDGKRISKREWQRKYGSEDYHLAKTNKLLGVNL